MRVVLTRSEADGADMAAQLSALGCDVIQAPLLTIDLVPVNPALLTSCTGTIITSRNGLRALVASPDALALAKARPLYAVGPATAALAREMGFQTIITGPGTAEGLAEVITRATPVQPSPGPLLHVAGDHLAGDLAGALAKAGVALTQVVGYRSVAAKTLAEPVGRALAAQAVDAVILMSPRTADIWALLAPADAATAANLRYICLSEAVAARLRQGLARAPGGPAPGPVIRIAARPNGEEVLMLMKRLAGHAKGE